MKIIDWFNGLFRKKPNDICITIGEAQADLAARELAFWTAINLIANAVSKCEFKTFIDGKEEKGPNYYRWNVRPNKNQNSSTFLREIVSKLYAFGECLVIEAPDKDLLVADSFERTEYAMYDNLYKDVTVGDFTFAKTFSESEVLYFSLGSVRMRELVNAMYAGYSKLLAYGMTSYQTSRGGKATFSYESIPPGETNGNAWIQRQLDKYSQFVKADGGVVSLGKGLSLTEFGQKTSETTRDIRAMIDDIADFTAKAFGIPPTLLRGDVAGIEDVLDQFLTFCIDPLCDLLQEEINRKLYTQAQYSSGNKTQIDTRTIKHIDLLSVASGIDKLISSGVLCINDIRELIGEARIDEDWANQHYVTKNYAPATEEMLALGGGD